MAIPKFLQLFNLGPKLAKLAGVKEPKLADGKLSAVSVMRVSEGAKAHIIAALDCKCLVVASDALGAKNLAKRIESWGVKTTYLPYRDDVLLARKGITNQNVYERMLALSDIANGEAQVVVTSADSLLQKFPSRRLVKEYTLTIKSADIIPPAKVADMLALAGYRRQEMVSEVGDFALRGDILDVYAPNKTAYRINFFDDLVEDIKVIDIDSMLSSNALERVSLPPVSDILLDSKGYDVTAEGLGRHINSKNAAQARSAINVGACNQAAIWALPFMESCTETLLEYFSDAVEIVFDEPKVVADKLEILTKEFNGRVKTLLEGGEIISAHKDVYIDMHELKRLLLLRRKMSLASLSLGNPLFEPTYVVEPTNKPVTKYYLDPAGIVRDVNNFIANGIKVMFATGGRESAKSVLEALREDGIGATYSEDGEDISSVCVTPLPILSGVNYAAAKVVVIGVSECIGKTRSTSAISHKKQFNTPKAGDYVVHRVHGVGRCEGTALLKTGDFEREYIVLKYRDGDTLYVATDQMSDLQKFVGEENPHLNKLGGKEFEREKEKVRKSVRTLALDLASLYARREKERGFKYSEDTIWQKEFEDAFEYEETPDQLKAIADIKRDMEQGRVMDRLLVGDVGFGKTEVAFRAMFKTVLDGKQAVLLAPTTILARQHYENIADRLKPFGIRCGLLTRLQTSAENRKLIEQLKDGTMHVVIATHKVLAKGVSFNDLGLLVLDEEQRFGVEHKEKLKAQYPLVNVLTLSATPIPRTLGMSLSGIRDISMLETAPQGRLPIQTYVVGYSDALVADAVTREMARGGQTFVLLNDVDGLMPFQARLNALVPDARVITAHGQMPAGQLEERMSAFYDKQYDVLVATTIIENGIDIPDANTLIVVDSGKFGLSQLYQLRGRVGRRGALAHAYFTLPENGALTDNAEKRLKTLLDNTEIGSGFRVALADLSIRGAGTLLGAEQSGHIEKVGYEMYLELLDEAVNEIRTGVTRKPVRDVEMKVDVAAYISEGYVSASDKLKIYKRISEVAGKAGRDELIRELTEVYGPVNKPLENLIDIALLKNLASRFDVSRIVINKNGAGVNFYDSEIVKNETLMTAVAEHNTDVVLTGTMPPSLLFNVKNMSNEDKLHKVLEFFDI